MIPLARDGYTEQEIKDALHGKRGTRKIRFRYDLLDKDDNKKGELTNVLGGEVSFAALNDIKRTAKFKIQDDGQIDWLSDRIQPFLELEMPSVQRQEKRKIRYIRDWVHGSSANTGNHWVEIKAIDHNGVNAALNKSVTYNGSPYSAPYNNPATVTNGVLSSEYFGTATGDPRWVMVDLESLIEIEEIKVWHYYNDGRRYYETKTEVSEDGVNWFVIFDSRLSGIYAETAQGKTHLVNLMKPIYLPSGFIEFPLGVFLLSSPTKSDTTGGVIRDVEAYDGTVILNDDKFDTLHTITAGTNYKTAVISLLQEAGINKFIIEDTTKVLPVDLEFETGLSKLSAVNKLLSQINFTPIRVDVNGYFVSGQYISPSARAIDYTYKDDSLSVTFKGMTEDLDLFNVPNKWVVVRTNAEETPLKSVYTNDNAESQTSTVNRGRTIVDYRELDNIADQPSLDAYTQRIAFEASQIFGKLQFNTAIMPMHDYYDILQIEYEGLSVSDKFTETAWSFPLNVGGRMKHEVRKVVNV